MKVMTKKWFWFLCSFLLYANTIKHSYVIDDIIAVTSNKFVQEGVSSVPDIFRHSYLYGYDGREDESYRPLTLTSFAMERSFLGGSSIASHFVQVLLYGLFMVVVFLFLRNLFGEGRIKTVIAICLLFLLHPLHTEVVANVKSRDELLAAFFLFAALWYYSKWILNAVRFNFISSLILFLLATLSKETAVLGVLLFPATYFYMKKASIGEVFINSFVYVVPFGCYFLIRWIVLSDVLIGDPIDPVSNSLALASSAGERFTSNLAIFSKYIQLCLFPLKLSWDYSVATLPLVGFGELSSITGLISMLFILGTTVIGILKRNLIGFGGLVFVSTFLLTSNFLFLINCPLGERFMFMPVLGLIIMIILILEPVIEKLPSKVPLILLAGASVLFGLRTIVRNVDWKDNLSIYESGVKVCPNSVKTHFNLATEYLEQGNKSTSLSKRISWYNRSIEQFGIAKRIYPEYENTYENLGFVYAELGKIATTDGDKMKYFTKGLTLLDSATIQMGLDKPTLYQNKIFILEQLGNLSKGEDQKEFMRRLVNACVQKKEKTAEDYQRMLFYLNQLGDNDQLKERGKEMADNFPEKAGMLFEFSKTRFTEGKYLQSIELLDIYLEAYPNDLSARSNKGMLLEILGKKNEALQVYEDILAKDPKQEHTKELYEKLRKK